MAVGHTLTRLRKIARLYLKLQLIQLRTVVEYRADFWIGILGSSLMHGAGLVFVIALFGQIDELGGWSSWEVAVLYGLTLMPAGLRELFCDGPWLLRQLVNSGEFDRLLVRPVSPAMQVATRLASVHGVGQLSLGAALMLVGTSRSDMEWAPWKAGFLLTSVLSSLGLLIAIGFLVNMIGFWEPSAQSAVPTAYAMLIDFAKFPLDIYGTVIKVLVTVVAPYAFVSYFPALVLLDKESPWRWLGFASPIVTLLAVLLTSRLWRTGLNRYQGVGH